MTEESFKNKSKDLLDEHSSALDAATLSKLHQSRNLALDAKPGRVTAPAGWIGAGALAASLTVAVVYFDARPDATLPVIYDDPLQQAVAEELELMDDLEFYAWLVLQEESFDEEEST